MDGQLILDRYRPLRELGAGGFAEVVLAWDTRMQRRVAIKRLPLPLDSAGRPHRPPGLAEARTAALLSHPAIVTALDFDTDSDEAFIVMEYVDGASLADVLDRVDGPLTLDEASAVAEAVAGALEHAHDNGVLHLDIKPENVLIGRDGRVKVTDFGISALSSLSGHGAAFGGTPGYMPAEQLEGREVSVRTDEWAFAALMFEVLTGDNPFRAPDVGTARAQLAVLDPDPPSAYVADIPSELDDVLLVALSDHPVDRYPDVTAFADTLLEHLGDPAEGVASLADIVDEFAEDEGDEDRFAEEHVGLWDRLGGRSGSLLLRLAAAIESGWLAWVGLTPLPLEAPAATAAIILVALAAALAPSLGVGLGLGCLVIGLAAANAVPAALVIAAAGGAWWWLLAREHPGAAVLPLAAPALSGARVGLLQPLLAGFTLPPAKAAATALFGGGLTFAASAATLNPAPYSIVGTALAADPWRENIAVNAFATLVADPAVYVAWLGWPLAAAIMSLCCRAGTRRGALLGAFGGAAALGGSYYAAELTSHVLQGTPGQPTWTGSALLWSLGGSLILMLLVVALGAPLRPEEHEPLPAHHPDE